MTKAHPPTPQARAALARGLQLLDRNDHDGAEAAFRQAIALSRAYWEAHANLGVALKAQGRLDEAAGALRKALKLAPPSAELLGTLANVHHAAGRLREAAQAYEQALTCNGRIPGIRMAFGALLMQMGRPQDAAGQFQAAVGLMPGDARAEALLGQALVEAGDRATGIGWLQRAAAVANPPPEALYCMADALLAMRRPDDAEPFARRLAETHPGFRGAWRLLGQVMATQGRTAGARQAFAREGDAAAATRALLCLPMIPRDRDEIAAVRAALAKGLAEGPGETVLPLAEVAGLPTAFLLSYHGEDNKALQSALAGYYRRLCPALAFTASHVGRPRRTGRRIRVGFLSEHFHDHTIGRLFADVIAGLPRDQMEVVIIAPRRADDPVRRRLIAAADRVAALDGDLAAAQRRVAELALDVLVYTDIGMGSLSYFLAHARLAPVQCVWWGHPETTGLDSIDVFVSCAAMEPDAAQAHYGERLAALPGPTIRYPRSSLERPRSRRDLGLPEDRTLYLCPQTLFKLHPDFDPVLAGILAQDPDGVLVLISDISTAVNRLLADRLAAAGVPPERVMFLPRLDHEGFLSLLAAADVMLDPLHYSGGNTSLEAFSFGTPIVTLPGRFMRGRHTFGFYRLMGLEDLVADSPERYIALAVGLGRDAAWRDAMRRRISTASGVLFDDAAASRILADLLRGL